MAGQIWEGIKLGAFSDWGAKAVREEGLYFANMKVEKMVDKTQWQFSSVHPADIDFQDIADSLTRKNPLAFVEGSYEVTKQRLYSDGECNGKKVPDAVRRKMRRSKNNYVKWEGSVWRRVVTPTGEDTSSINYYQTYKTTKYERYVVIRDSITAKADRLGLMNDAPNMEVKRNLHNAVVVSVGMLEYFAKWQAWAKKVKEAPWKTNSRRKAKFTVKLANI